jgi:hypothetical protein
MNPYLEKCTFSGRTDINTASEGKTSHSYLRRKFSISEEFRLNAAYREEKNGELSYNEIQRKFNNNFHTGDAEESEPIYLSNSSH